MCGRARCTFGADDIPRACHRADGPVRTVDMDRYRPSYNVAPGSNLPVLRRDDGSDGGGVVVHCMKWGLIPSFTKKTEKPDFYKMFNARSESVSEKASFRRLLPKSRCLVVVEGFYEWKKDGSKKQPYYIHFKDGRPLVFAALYDSWQSSEGEILHSFTIITTSSSSALQWLHDRMPVILGDKGSTDAWLNGSSTSKFDTILQPYKDSDLVWYPVTPAMGKPSFDGPECIKKIQLKAEGKNPISNFFTRKESKKEQGPNQEEKNSFDKSVKTNLREGLKGEPNKEIKEEQESNREDNSLFDESFKIDLPKASKEEATKEIKEEELNLEENTFYTGKGDRDLKSSVSILPDESTAKCQPKRDYDQFQADSKLATGRTDKLGCLGMSPVKKKGNLMHGGDKQPTLFSYFGKR